MQQIGANLTDKTKDLGASVVAKTGHFLNDPVGQLDTLAGAGVQNSTVLPEETENTVSLDHLEEK